MKNSNFSKIILLPLLLAASSCSKTMVIPFVAAPEVPAAPESPESPSARQNRQMTANAADGAECLSFIQSLPSDWSRGFMSLPEDSSRPTGEKVTVFYYTNFKAHVSPALADASGAESNSTESSDQPLAAPAVMPNSPVVFFNGGPLISSHESYHLMTSKEQVARDPNKAITWLFIDQRGTGCSSGFPAGKDQETIKRLSHYGSKDIVLDAEAIRKEVMKEAPWVIFGQGYGSQIVHRYLTDFPEAVQSAFSHGGSINKDGYLAMKNRIKSQARVLDLYVAANGKKDLEILQKLYASPIAPATSAMIDQCLPAQAGQKKTFCVYDVLSFMASNWLGVSDNWGLIHQWLPKLLNADGTLNIATLSDFKKNYPVSTPRPAFDLASLVLSHADLDLVPFSKFECSKIAKDLQDMPLLNECLAVLRNKLAPANNSLEPIQNQVKKDPISLSTLKNNLMKDPEKSLYLYSSAKDSYGPIENFAEEMAALTEIPNAHLISFEASGHEGFFKESDIWTDLISEITKD